MTKVARIVLLPLMIVALMVGCSQDSNQFIPTGSAQDSDQVIYTGSTYKLASELDGLMASSVQSANLVVRVNRISNNDISVHNVTDAWDEMAVTYNSFGGAFDATVLGTFNADAWALHYVDITPLVISWLDGTTPNNGVLLEHLDLTYPMSGIYSRETDPIYNVQPALEICYLTDAGTQCVTIVANADTYIQEFNPDGNYGLSGELYIGFFEETELEKQTLIRFDMPEQPEPASIGDYVWLDDNENGIQDLGEVGLPNVEVHLYDCFGGLVGMTTTDANGYYLFDNLTPGDYNVMFVKPEGYVYSPQDMGGDDAMDSDADPVTGMTICTTLDPGEHDPTWDAGLYLPVWEGCSLTIGFWKTHAGFGPQADVVTPLLPISLGSFDVTDATIAHDVLVMKTYGTPSNGITKLMAQLLGTKLNGANGADLGAVASEIADADAFLSSYDWTDWKSLSKNDKKMVISLMSAFDDYNNGLIGPGHCE